jgi:hypothetical protein
VPFFVSARQKVNLCKDLRQSCFRLLGDNRCLLTTRIAPQRRLICCGYAATCCVYAATFRLRARGFANSDPSVNSQSPLPDPSTRCECTASSSAHPYGGPTLWLRPDLTCPPENESTTELRILLGFGFNQGETQWDENVIQPSRSYRNFESPKSNDELFFELVFRSNRCAVS